MVTKAETLIGRFREIISDPINLLIERDQFAGTLDTEELVILHNGTRVPAAGPFSYYEEFSKILQLNRGVHEPLEEYCFQEFLKRGERRSEAMLELGAYWGHYSMWFASRRPGANCYLVEPDSHNLEVGRRNFQRNGLVATFINDAVAEGHFTVDEFIRNSGVHRLNVLHADIQGFEVQMLEGSRSALSENRIDFAFISTHSEAIHSECLSCLGSYRYRVEVSSGVDFHTTGYDGFILASSLDVNPVFRDFKPLGRVDILRAKPEYLVNYICDLVR